LSSAVVRFISRAVGRSEQHEVRGVFCTSFYLFLVLGLVTAGLTSLLAFFLKGIVKNPQDLTLFRWLLLILGFNFAIDFPVRAFNAVFTSTIRDDISVGLSTVKSVIAAALIYWVVKIGHGVMAVAVVSVGMSLLDDVARVWLAYRLEPALSLNPRYIDWARVKPLFNYSAFTFLARLGDLLQFRVDNLVITAYIGLAPVTHFFVASRLVEYLREALAQTIRGMTPIFSQDEGRSDFSAIRRNFMYVTKLCVYVSVFCCALSLIYGREFFARWMGPRYVDAYPVLVVLIAGLVFRLVQLPASPLLYGISKHKYYAYSTIAEGILNLVLSIVFVKRYGILGVALGTAIPMALMNVIVQPIYISYVAGVSWSEYVLHILRHSATALVVIAVGWAATRPLVEASYGALVLCGLIQTVIFVPAVIRLGLTGEERSRLFSVLVQAMPFTNRGTPVLAGANK
ncbi:MAG: oligosaccharide flippase family protein, partial [Elusimicrobia bacterium]|nr:oligosaccharide flippase family protein [Elusimicrobiota bacterium]